MIEKIERAKNKVAVKAGYSNWEEMENWIIDHNQPVNVAVLLVGYMTDVLEEYASQSKQSGGWVKASERTPANSNLVHINFGTKKTRMKTTGYYEDGIFKGQFSHEKISFQDNIEWFDESAASINETLLEALKRVRETIIKAGDVFTWASELKIIDNALAGEVSDNKPLEALREIANINGSQSDLEMLTEAISIASNALSEYGKNSLDVK